MQNNKIIQLVMLAVMMLFAVWAVSALLEARHATRGIILGVGFFVILLLTLWRKIPLDAKLLFIVILGYALGGKGFAYVSPFEPVYISEICLVLCLSGLVMRPKQMGLLDTSIHKLIFVYLIYSGIHLTADYAQYGLMAVRDSSMAYYSLYYIVGYSLFRNEIVLNTFEKVIKVALFFSVIQFGYASIGWAMGIGFLPWLQPHPDAYIPLNVGAVLYFVIIGIRRRKIHYIACGCLIAVGLLLGKTAALLALAGAISCAIIFGRVKGLIIPIILMMAFGLFAIALMIFVDSELVIDALAGGKTAEAFGIEEGQFVGFSEATGTTKWRWDWWMTIWDDTMRMSPMWGQGFGADITGPFLEMWLGPEYAEAEGYARYPHCILFTLIGRLGLIGVAIFLPILIAIGLLTIKFSRRLFASDSLRDADLICFGVVFAGVVNGLIQATYEIPYAAITHWVCLAYLAVRYYGPTSYEQKRGLERSPA